MSLDDAWNLIKKVKKMVCGFLIFEIEDDRLKEHIEKLENKMDRLQEKHFSLSFIPGYGDIRRMIRSYLLCVLGSAMFLGVIAQWMKILVMTQRKFRWLLVPWYTFLHIPKSLVVGVFLYLGWAVLNYFSSMSPLRDEERNFEYAPTNECGSARPLVGKAYEECIEEVKPGDSEAIILGYTKNDSDKVCCIRTAPKGRRPTVSNPHIAACGGSGSGKSFSLARPAIFQAIQAGRSFIVTETSGELYQDTSEIARKHGYDVKILNYIPDSIGISDSCNYISQIVRGDSNKAITLATVILENTTENRGFWDDAQKNVLTSLLLMIDGSKSIPEEQKNLGTVLDYITEGPKSLCSRIQELPDKHPAKNCGLLFVNSPQKVQESAVYGLGVRLQIFMEPKVRNAVSYDEVSLSAPGERKCAYYVNISDTESTYQVLSALFFNFTFVELGNMARRQKGNPRLPVNVDVILDEFTNCGTLNDFDITVSTVRKYGIRIYIIFQDIGQVINRYKTTYSTILANCAVSIFMGGNDAINNPPYYSKLYGTATIIDASESRPVNIFFPNFPLIHRKMMYRTKPRPIYTEDEIVDLDSDYVIVKLERRGPLKIRKFDYRDHPLFEETVQCNIYDHVPAWQLKGREKANIQKSNMQIEVPLKKMFEKDVKAKMEQVITEEVTMSGIETMRRIMPLTDEFTSVPVEEKKDIKTAKKEDECITENNDEDEFMLSDARSSSLKQIKKTSIKDF